MDRFQGRYAAKYDKDFVLYVFGLRINKPLKVRDWFGVMKYSYNMRNYLNENKQLGMLHAERAFIHGSPCVLSYWNSFEELEAFARDRDNLHISGWRWYNSEVHKNGSVGMWHEMYRVPAGHVAGLYNDLPRMGLGVIGTHTPVGSTLRTAAQRLGLRDDDPGVDPETVAMPVHEYAAVDADGAQANGAAVPR